MNKGLVSLAVHGNTLLLCIVCCVTGALCSVKAKGYEIDDFLCPYIIIYLYYSPL